MSPASGFAGAKVVATYSFTAKGSCASYHKQVTWSFGSTVSWATSPVPTGTGTSCTSSTPPTPPPSGAAPGSYMVCGTDAPVTPTPACATYTIKPAISNPTPGRSPTPIPSSGASPSPAPSQSASPAPGVIGGTDSPAASPGSAPPPGAGGDDAGALQPTGRTGGIPGWPWTVLFFVIFLITLVWRFRSWLVGVFENVEVLGVSGADLETELLQHEASPEPPSVDAVADPPPESTDSEA